MGVPKLEGPGPLHRLLGRPVCCGVAPPQQQTIHSMSLCHSTSHTQYVIISSSTYPVIDGQEN